MTTDRGVKGTAAPADGDDLSVVREAEDLGAQKRPHGDAQQWLDRNLQEQERGPVVHPDAPREEQVADEQRAPDTDEGNLIELPIGARFELDHEPSPQEREDLVRFAAAANAELHGHRESLPDKAEPERGRRQGEQGQLDEE